MSALKAGDVVQLRCGGPMMVISNPLPSMGAYRCRWFDDQGHLQSADLPVEALKIELEAKPE